MFLKKVKSLFAKDYFSEEKEVFSNIYLEELKNEILNSAYLEENNLNYNFSTTLGFSIIFKKGFENKVIEKFPFLETYLNKIISPLYNAYYLNPLVMPINSNVGKHIDHSLRSYYLNISIPKKVSVLYVNVPEMSGGNLILYNEAKFVAKIRPELNKFIQFQGYLKHEVTSISEMKQENEQYRISLVCEQYKLNNKEFSKIPDFLIRSSTAFNNFLKEEMEI